MRHRANPKFWRFYAVLPENIQRLADENYKILKRNPYHPSLHFKKVGLTVWFDDQFLNQHWCSAPNGKRGAPL